MLVEVAAAASWLESSIFCRRTSPPPAIKEERGQRTDLDNGRYRRRVDSRPFFFVASSGGVGAFSQQFINRYHDHHFEHSSRNSRVYNRGIWEDLYIQVPEKKSVKFK